jgi:MoaA/NifB/PqqE/SkfB family radical SAM enzyme
MWSADTLEWIDIELTSFCNIKCKGCFREQSVHAPLILNKELISLETIKQRFSKDDFPNIKIINFCGSVDEPTSHPQFHQIIEYFASWNCHINIATNGSIRTKLWWEKLAKLLPPSHKVTWGIDGSDNLSEFYRVGSSFKKVQENFRSFIAAGGQSTWQFIEFEHNKHQTAIARQLAKDEGFSDFKIIISHRIDTKDIVHTKIEKVESPCIECKYSDQKRIFINHFGDVIPCCHLNAKMLEFNVTHKEKDKFEKILNEHNVKDGMNLKYNTIKEVIEGPVFNAIIDSWTGEDKIKKCVSTCKQKNRDVWVKESLKSV